MEICRAQSKPLAKKKASSLFEKRKQANIYRIDSITPPNKAQNSPVGNSPKAPLRHARLQHRQGQNPHRRRTQCQLLHISLRVDKVTKRTLSLQLTVLSECKSSERSAAKFPGLQAKGGQDADARYGLSPHRHFQV